MKTEMERIGTQMANVLFNMAQLPGERITYQQAEFFDGLRRQWDAARRTTPPSPSTAEVDERAAFEAWHRDKFATRCWTGQPTRDMHNGVYAEEYGPQAQQHMWEAFRAGAVLASRPAVEAGELPPLPEPIMGLWSANMRKAWNDQMRDYGQECARAALATKPATKEN